MRLLVVALVLMLSACQAHRPELPDYGFVPPFKLVAQDGRTFDSQVLRRSIWVADFIFTTCNGPCPRMTSQMHQIQEATWKMRDVKLVSFTVDPARDTPEILAKYAKLHHASPEHWYFLTGPTGELQHLGRDVFKLNDVDGALAHSTRFVLVDGRQRMRGYYDTSEPESITKLISDIHVLARRRD